MKKIYLLLIVIFVGVFVSCQKEEFNLSGVDSSGDIPSTITKNTNWCWVTEKNFLATYDEIGDGCNQYYDDYNSSWNFYDCGVWVTVDVPMYYGTVDGVRYVAPNSTTLIMSHETYLNGLDLVTKFKTVKAYFDKGQNPVGQNFMRIESFEQL
ncbi:MAG: hypothetical protein WC755_07630 [Candidatus Woesearchaeota archaeon]